MATPELAPVVHPRPVTDSQIALVKRTIAQGATDEELKLYLFDCERHGVHPLDRMLHFTKRGGRYTPITSIDLMRARAAETGECAGITDPEFTDDLVAGGLPVGKRSEYPLAATVRVYRLVQGQRCEFTATARWAEYYPGDQQGMMWKKMPHTMLGKCAEALALRKAFPKQLQGLYEHAEMEQAHAQPVAPVVPERQNVIEAQERLEPARTDGSVVITDVVEQSGNSKKGAWTRWQITFDDGRTMSTFNKSLAGAAETAKQDGSLVIPITEQKGAYTNLVSLTPAELVVGPVGEALDSFAAEIDAAALDEAKERGALMAEVKRLADKIGLATKDRHSSWATYLGEATPADAPLEGLNDLLAWLRTRAGE